MIPVITHYDQVTNLADLRKDEARCAAAFNTSHIISLANLNALRRNPFTADAHTLALQEV